MNIKKAKPAEIALDIVESLPPMAKDKVTGELYYYEDGYYIVFPKNDLLEYICRFFYENDAASAWTESKAVNIAAAVKYNPYKVPKVKFNDHGAKVNLANGVLDLDEMKLRRHDSTYYFTYKLDVEYKPGEKECPNFVGFLESILTKRKGDEIVPDQATISSVLKIGGYLIYPYNKMEKLFLFLGEGSNGKSLLIDIFQSFFPDEFVTSLSLKTISDENSFARSKLLNSRLNVSAEEKGQKIDAEQIKRIVSGQSITVDPKFKEHIDFIPQTKIVVDSNGIPYFNDATYGTLRRLYLIHFPNKFVPYADYRKISQPEKYNIFPRKEKKPFFDKIMKEKPAILNMFLWGLEQLKNDEWTLPETLNTQEMFEEYREQTDTLGSWLVENFEAMEESWGIPEEGESSNFVLNKFKEYYESNFPGKKFNYSTKAIGRRIKEIFRVDAKRVTKRDNSGHVYGLTFYPIKYKNNYDEEPEPDFQG